MPGIRCKCGEILRYGEIPNPIEWNIISDVEMDRFTGLVDAGELYREMKSMLLCPSCGRLWIYWNGFDQDPQEYVGGPGDSADVSSS